MRMMAEGKRDQLLKGGGESAHIWLDEAGLLGMCQLTIYCDSTTVLTIKIYVLQILTMIPRKLEQVGLDKSIHIWISVSICSIAQLLPWYHTRKINYTPYDQTYHDIFAFLAVQLSSAISTPQTLMCRLLNSFTYFPVRESYIFERIAPSFTISRPINAIQPSTSPSTTFMCVIYRSLSYLCAELLPESHKWNSEERHISKF